MKIKSSKEKVHLMSVNLENDADDNAGTSYDFYKLDQPDLNKMLDEVIKKKGDFFCSQPFIHMYMPTYGYQHVCCNTSMSVKKHISETSIEDLYNEPEFKNLRKEIVKNHTTRERTIKTCIRCIQTEYHGFPSLRESYNHSANKNIKSKKELNRLVTRVLENPDAYYKMPEVLHTVELKVWGNYCNLKCLMCSPEDSSSVAEEQMQLGEKSARDIKKVTEWRTGRTVSFEPPLITYEDNHLNEDEFWSIIKRAIRIKLIGGETWLQKQNIQLLEKCIKNGWAAEKELIIFTNNYGYPKMNYIKQLLSHFKHVSYKCSLEMWGEKNDYIRYPSQWKEVYNNMKLISKLRNVVINPTCTLNPLTLGYVHEIIQGTDEFERHNLNFSNVKRPKWFTAHCLPDDIVDFYLDRYYSLPYDIIAKCSKAIETLEQREFNELRYFEMIAKIKGRDKLRGDNILKYFPEWKPHFLGDEYYGFL